MRIAIVDDSVQDRLELKQQIQTAMSRRNQEAFIFEYKNGSLFLQAAGEKPFDLVFMDIYMEEGNGIEIAQKLRTFDSGCTLVFTTVSTDHALEAYQVQALQYLVKPYAPAEIEAVFRLLERRSPIVEKAITISSGRQSLKLLPNDILWADHFQHQIYIHTLDEEEKIIRMKFAEFAALLATDDRFFICGRGVLVNLAHVSDFTGTEFLLDNGFSVPVSRSTMTSARQRFGEYLLKRREGL